MEEQTKEENGKYFIRNPEDGKWLEVPKQAYEGTLRAIENTQPD